MERAGDDEENIQKREASANRRNALKQQCKLENMGNWKERGRKENTFFLTRNVGRRKVISRYYRNQPAAKTKVTINKIQENIENDTKS